MEKTESWLSSYHSHDEEIHSNYILSAGKSKESLVFAVSSGKGGVGKTTISLKLAERLSADGLKVLLVDCDYNLSNTGVQLGLKLKNNFYELVSSQKEFHHCVEHVRGFDLLMACNGSSDLFTYTKSISDILLDIVSSHRDEYDVVLLDCAAGLNNEVLKLCAYADIRIMVATPDPSSITDTYSSIKVLRNKFNVTFNHLIVNKVCGHEAYKRVVKTISETAERFLMCQTKILGSVEENKKNSVLGKKFFTGKNCQAYRNILKILEKYSENIISEVPLISSGQS